MPIPTETYRNIKVLNWLFAGSALLLLGVMGLSVVQDYHKSWRQPQMNNRVWEAALVDDKLRRAETPERKRELGNSTGTFRKNRRSSTRTRPGSTT